MNRSMMPRRAGLLAMLLLWAFLSLGAGLAHAARSVHGQAVFEDDVAQVEATLLVRQGTSNRIGVLFELEPGWHLYWRNPGDTGIAPSLDFESAGWRVGEIEWPVPETFTEADGLFTTYGYADRVLLAADLERVSGSPLDPKADSIRLDATVLVCRTQCVPASFQLETQGELALARGQAPEIEALFEAARQALPESTHAVELDASAYWHDGQPEPDAAGAVSLHIESCARDQALCQSLKRSGSKATFLPFESERLEVSEVETLERNAPAMPLQIQMSALPLEESASFPLQGLIAFEDETGRRRGIVVEVPIAPHSAKTARFEAVAPIPIVFGPWQWLRIFGLALIGGLILNAMPCVLPVLAIKVVAVADLAERDPREVRLHGLAYTFGVLASMALLAGIVLSMRAAGQAVGWGFQFQEPLFVVAISALLVAFALNLFGVFEIELGQGRLASVGQEASGVRRSIFEGLLAVVLATPCTAPFLGTAVGFAFASSGLGIVAIFLAIGLGLAAPFLAVSFVPGFARFIPRSGPWMLKLRAGLGFSLLATVVWLLWVIGQSAGADGVIATTALLLALAFSLWAFGQVQPLRSVWMGRLSALAIFCLALTGFNLIDLDEKPLDDTAAETPIDLEVADAGLWSVYSPAGVERALAEGRPAFVVFTADWCITCQVNERTVLSRDDVLARMQSSNFALFKADWTRRDDAIRRKLAEFGRAGVPLYLVYRPDAPGDPQILSELLTAGEVTAALSNAAGPERG